MSSLSNDSFNQTESRCCPSCQLRYGEQPFLTEMDCGSRIKNKRFDHKTAIRAFFIWARNFVIFSYNYFYCSNRDLRFGQWKQETVKATIHEAEYDLGYYKYNLTFLQIPWHGPFLESLCIRVLSMKIIVRLVAATFPHILL